MTAAETQARAAWTTAHDEAVDAVRAAQACIQALAVLTEGDADMKLCFAGGALHGTLALLREADQIHRRPRCSCAPCNGIGGGPCKGSVGVAR